MNPSDRNDLEAPDNIVITPWGDLWIAEDGGGVNRIIGLTPEGNIYIFAENAMNGSEFAGPTFSMRWKYFLCEYANSWYYICNLGTICPQKFNSQTCNELMLNHQQTLLQLYRTSLLPLQKIKVCLY